MSDFLFDEFPSIPSKQWKQKIQFDLNGADYNNTLLTHTNDGITIKPFYHSDEYKSLDIPSTNGFKICQSIFISVEKTANFLALDSLNRGATSILFTAKNPFDIVVLFKNIPKETEIQFDLQFLSESFLIDLNKHLKDYPSFLNIDIVGNLAKTGNWFKSIQSDFKILSDIFQKHPESNNILVDASIYQNAGANSIQQVAYALAHANEYLNHINNGIAKSEAMKQSFNFNFKLAIGSNYFFEIAKLRALKHLFKRISSEYSFDTNFTLFSEPTLRNKTLYDYNTNMLRTSSECMSAILGGSNTICNKPYDSIFHKKNEFGERIARNQLLILKEESGFHQASEFTNGSYYIDSLTNEIAEKALAIFKDIEKGGGFLKLLKEGTIQRKISESAEKEQVQFDNKELVILGTNKHPNMGDKMKDNLELFPFLKIKSRKTLLKPIISKRLSEQVEQERLKNEA